MVEIIMAVHPLWYLLVLSLLVPSLMIRCEEEAEDCAVEAESQGCLFSSIVTVRHTCSVACQKAHSELPKTCCQMYGQHWRWQLQQEKCDPQGVVLCPDMTTTPRVDPFAEFDAAPITTAAPPSSARGCCSAHHTILALLALSIPIVPYDQRRGLRTGSGWDESPTVPSRSSGGSTAVVSSQEWLEKLTAVELDEEDVARLVLDYFQVTERSAAAAEFVIEAGLTDLIPNGHHHHHHSHHVASSSSSSSSNVTSNGVESAVAYLPPGTRAQIRQTLINDDDPLGAERLLDALDPKILIENPTIHIRLRIAELVKLPPASELLKFVQDKVAPLIGNDEGKDDDDSTDLLEKAMMLITFGKSASMSSLKGLQCKLMEDLDAAILRHFDMSPTPLLTSIVRYMAMEQAKAAASLEASGAVCVVPQLADVGAATFSTTMASPPNTSSDEGVVPLATLLGGPSQADDSSDDDNNP
ncbi:Glucose-induced degradation complex subunit [Perkinsus olseni]|uniref:Glucose-induced degradation complex subunit n=1 Tax=Perkinsus olseni TaxID=32597 RepID=A0A7J6LAI4_PEROL|nr:Glucose-induced degradation complex subunit [Perkinsus olseni]